MEVPDIEGYETVLLERTDHSVSFRINLKTEEEFKVWKNAFFQLTSSNFNVKYAHRETQKSVFQQTLVCHHGARFRSENSRKTNTR